MKPLLSKTTKPFLIYVLIVLVISIPVYFFVVNTIWENELDDHNNIIADKTAYEFNRLQLSDEALQNSIRLWNKIQPGTNIQPVSPGDKLNDSAFTVETQIPYAGTPDTDRFRCLSTVIYLNKKPYRFTVQTNIEESRETIAVIAATTIFFFLVIVAGLLFLSRRLSQTVWQPFRNTLDKLKKFNLNSQAKIEFAATDITEFEELNRSLTKLIEHNVSVYKTQKEFTENASHELQTPLAILKNKLDILLQSDDLTAKQYRIAEEMNNALTRSSRINTNLLLLAKIDNNQFDGSELIYFDVLLRQSQEILREHFDHKNITVSSNIMDGVKVRGNSSLAEILINNLLLNAIRHTPAGGEIKISLTQPGFEVSNSGTEALHPDWLFKRFSRLSADNRGSGLGLSIVQQIVRFHQWQVRYRFENNFHIFSIHFL
jgi:signal transduction histidine kinase